MFIVLTMHCESLRQMMAKGLVDHSIKIQVLQMLKAMFAKHGFRHGDIKDFDFKFSQQDFLLNFRIKNQPDNILVDYQVIAGKASNFKSVLADYGTSAVHLGGTPLYAGPRTYEIGKKDLFSFARLSLELFMEYKAKV